MMTKEMGIPSVRHVDVSTFGRIFRQRPTDACASATAELRGKPKKLYLPFKPSTTTKKLH